ITQPLWVCTYSTGSSMVTMCPRVLSLRYPTMVASVVDLPEPVPPTTITRPRLLSTTSLRIGGRSSSSKVGILALISRMTQPTAACCTKALTRKRPMPGGAIAKLHSLVASNSRVCRSFITARSASQGVLVLRLVARLFLADHALGDQLREALVERLHALRDAGLDGGVHLRDLTLADEVADRRRPDHDLVGRHPTAAVLLHQRLRDHLALVDETALGIVHELDRILDGDDVVGAIVVAVIDHGGQRGGLARAGRTGHQHQSPRQHAQVAEDLRRVQLIERQNQRRDVAEHGARAAVLVECIDAEARQLWNLEREVGFEELLVGLALLVVHDVVHHG